MSKPTNPQAFPVDGQYAGESLQKGNAGMTLRDYFAAKAMQGLMSTWEQLTPFETIASWKRQISEASYEIADAMLKEREQTE